MKVLIIEDQPIIIKILSNLVLELYPNALIKSSIQTIVADSLIKSYDFDLIITDLDFNGEKRFSVVELAKNYKIKCIIYTGHYNKAFINKAIELGVVAFISKMGALNDLQYALENYKNINNFICNFCKTQNQTTAYNIEILTPNLTPTEERILDRILSQKERNVIAKEFAITLNSLNTYINRMTTKNKCNLSVLIHRYIVWKRSLK
jgi:DNA-binding NarL/FixJ family response regulator